MLWLHGWILSWVWHKASTNLEVPLFSWGGKLNFDKKKLPQWRSLKNKTTSSKTPLFLPTYFKILFALSLLAMVCSKKKLQKSNLRKSTSLEENSVILQKIQVVNIFSYFKCSIFFSYFEGLPLTQYVWVITSCPTSWVEFLFQQHCQALLPMIYPVLSPNLPPPTNC